MGLPGVLNKVDACLYARYAMTAAAAGTTVSLFQAQVGAAGVTLQDTNMRAPGQMPRPEKFLVRAIRYIPLTAVVADARLLDEEVVAEIKVNNKNIAEWLCALIPGGSGVPGTTDVNGIADMRATYTFDNPITLDTQVPFTVDLHIGAIGALTVDTDIIVVLDGTHFKAVG